MSKSTYTVVRVDERMVVIHDEDIGMSVTNDAEQVVRELAESGVLSGKSLFYRDTQGQYDELLHIGGEFAGFQACDEIQRERLKGLCS